MKNLIHPEHSLTMRVFQYNKLSAATCHLYRSYTYGVVRISSVTDPHRYPIAESISNSDSTPKWIQLDHPPSTINHAQGPHRYPVASGGYCELMLSQHVTVIQRMDHEIQFGLFSLDQ